MSAKSMLEPSNAVHPVVPMQQPERVNATSHLLAQQVQQSLVHSLRNHISASNKLGIQRWRRPLPHIRLIVLRELLLLLLGSRGRCSRRSGCCLLRINAHSGILCCVCCIAIRCLQVMQ